MEVIRKKISIDSCRSHKNGLLPFIDEGKIQIDIPNIYNEDGSKKYPNYNYGQFVCDLKTNGKVIKYLDIINAYNFILNELNNGFFGYGIKDNNRFIIKKCQNNPNICDSENYKCPDDIFNYKPLNIIDFKSINDDVYEKEYNGESNGYYVLLENFDEIVKKDNYFSSLLFNKIEMPYNNYFIKQVKTHFINRVITTENFNVESTSFNLIKPTVDIHIFLDNEVMNDTIYYPYEYSYNEDRNETYLIYDDSFDYITTEKKFKDVNFEVESKLDSLYHYSAIELNEDIFGIPKDDFNIYSCYFLNGKWNSSVITNTKNFKCKNGEKLRAGTKEYHNIPFLSCLNYMNEYKDGGTYYFSVRYKNDISTPIDIPFKVGEELNKTTYPNGVETCDFIKNIKYNDSNVEITYVIGAEKNDKNNTGIVYKEILNYNKTIKNTFVDGFEVDLYYNYLDYDTNIKSIYNVDYNMECNVRIANIIKMEMGDINNSGYAIDIPLFTKEISDSLTTIPKIDTDIIFNRGNAAGWEKHFKLSECNTMKDLENYGNNFFNL